MEEQREAGRLVLEIDEAWNTLEMAAVLEALSVLHVGLALPDGPSRDLLRYWWRRDAYFLGDWDDLFRGLDPAIPRLIAIRFASRGRLELLGNPTVIGAILAFVIAMINLYSGQEGRELDNALKRVQIMKAVNELARESGTPGPDREEVAHFIEITIQPILRATKKRQIVGASVERPAEAPPTPSQAGGELPFAQIPPPVPELPKPPEPVELEAEEEEPVKGRKKAKKKKAKKKTAKKKKAKKKKATKKRASKKKR